jgi:hypothetical protein
MDNIFLQEISETYLNDRDIKVNKDEIFHYLVNTRKYLKENDMEIYETIQYDYSKLKQQKLFYRLLDEKYDLVEEFDLVTGTAATGLGIAAIWLIHKLFDEYDHFLSKLFGSLHKLHVSIRERIKKSRPLEYSKEKAERFEIVSKMLDGEYSTCAQSCGVTIDPRKLDSEQIDLYMHALFNPTEDKKFLGPKHAADAQCIVGCYLDYITGAIAELNLLYRQCLNKTGENNTLNNNPTTQYQVPIGSGCDQLRQDINDLKKEFDKFIKHLYKDNPRLKATWINILNQKIDEAVAGKKITSYGPMSVNIDMQKQYIGL